MTQEEKELLLKDICARLPYGIKCTTKLTGYNDVYIIQGVYEDNVFIDCPVYEEGDDEWMIESIIPYLRPMSSMTEEELNECVKYSGIRELECPHIETFKDRLQWSIKMFGTNYKSIDWLNKKMFDYRGLIPLKLAVEAPKDMYNTKTKL